MRDLKPKCLLTCEILWDCFDDVELLGGATLNVAYHLNQLATEPVILSSVGSDALGEKAVGIIRDQWGCDTAHVRVLDDVGTGKVQVTLDDRGDATYSVLTPAAWDFVDIDGDRLLSGHDIGAFVYGSVFLRSDYNRQQADAFLDRFDGLKCIDVNLRPPHNSPDMVLEYAAKADFVKANDQELTVLTSDLPEETALRDRIAALAEKLGIDTLCVTRAGESAVLLYKGRFYEGSTYPVTVRDTVGAGDAFFAAMVDSLLCGRFEPTEALNRAIALGSWVASQQGAQPDYDNAAKQIIRT